MPDGPIHQLLRCLRRTVAGAESRGATDAQLLERFYRVALRAKGQAAQRLTCEQAGEGLPAGPVGGPDPCDEAARRELGQAIDQEVSRLSRKYREAFVLRCLAGKTGEEAARELGCPVGTVESRLARARARLRAGLARRGFVVPIAGLAAGLAPGTAGAGVVTPLVVSTVKAAALVAAGQAVPAGVVSVRAVALMEGVLRAMLVSKIKCFTAVLLVPLLLGPATGLLAYRALAQGPVVPKDPAALGEGGRRGPRLRWEYKVLTRPEVEALAGKRVKTDRLTGGRNRLGSEGWQLVAVEPGQNFPSPTGAPSLWTPSTYLFKRPR